MGSGQCPYWAAICSLLVSRFGVPGIAHIGRRGYTQVSWWLCYSTSCHCNKHLRQSTYKEERVILACSFGGSSPWSGGYLTNFRPLVEVGSTSWWEHVGEENHFRHGQEVKENEEGLGSHYCLQGPPVTWRPLTRPHLLKVLLFPPSVTLGTIPLTCGSLGDIPDSNYSTGW
jgi:hypothetical protein